MQILKIISQSIVVWGIPFFVFATNPGDIIINEIAYDLKDADSGHEWVEIYNATPDTIDLTGWKFNDGSNHILTIPPKNGGQGSLTLSAGNFMILTDDAIVFLSDHPGYTGSVIDTVMSLNNTQATLLLSDNNNITIDSVTYNKDWGASGNSKTLERLDTQSPTDASHWQESTQDNGTPGTHNGLITQNSSGDTQLQNATSTSPILSSPQLTSTGSQNPLQADAGENIVGKINDPILFNGFGIGGNSGALSFVWNFGDGTFDRKAESLHVYDFPGTYIATLTVSNNSEKTEDQIEVRVFPDSLIVSEFMPNPETENFEWIEIANSAQYGVDISGWGLSTKKEKPSYIIPNGTFLPHNGFLVFSDRITNITLNNTKGAVFLFYPTGQIVSEISYENPKKGFSAASINGTQFFWTKEQTPGMKNIFIGETAAYNTNFVSMVLQEENTNTTSIKKQNSYAVYEKMNGIKSFLGEPAFAEVINQNELIANTEPPSTNGIASVFNVFNKTFSLIVLGIILLMWLGYIIKKNPTKNI